MMDTDFYLVEYQGGTDGCPVFLNGDESNDWEWDIYDPDPWGFSIENSYEFRSSDRGLKELELDYAGSPHRFVSEEFLRVCDDLNVIYRAVPVTVFLASGITSRKKYYYFLAAQWASLVDDEKSTCALEQNLTGGSPGRKYYGNVKRYAWISNLIVRENIGLDLFWCAEFMQHTCSKRFAEVAMTANLKGLKFIPLDSSFKYDPWGDLV